MIGNLLPFIAWGENVILSILAKLTAVISLIASTYIVYDVLQNPERRKESTYHRIILGVSTSDIYLSLGIILFTSLPTPPSLGSGYTVIKFFYTSAFSVAILYLCSLSTYYLLQLKFHLPDLKMKSIEKWLHLLPWSVGFAVAGVGIATIIIPLLMNLLSLIYIIITMYMVYQYVLKIELDALKFSIANYRKNTSGRNRNNINRRRSRRVIIQGVFYCTALILTCIFPLLNVLTQERYFELSILNAIFVPLHGFYNFLIYQYPVFQKFSRKIKKKMKERKERKEDENHPTISIKSLFCGVGCCFKNNSRMSEDPSSEIQTSKDDVNKVLQSINNNNDGEECQVPSIGRARTLAKGNIINYNEYTENEELHVVGGSLLSLVSDGGSDHSDSLTQIGLRSSLRERVESSRSKSLSDLNLYMDLESGESLKNVKIVNKMPLPSNSVKKTSRKSVSFLPEVMSENQNQDEMDIQSSKSLKSVKITDGKSSLSNTDMTSKLETERSVAFLPELILNDQKENFLSSCPPARYLERQKSMRNLAILVNSMEKACLSLRTEEFDFDEEL